MTDEKYFNLKSLRNDLEKSDLDVLVAASPYNIHFTSGAPVARTVRDPSGEYRLFFSITPKDGDQTLIIVGWEEMRSRATSWIKDIRPYWEFKEPPLEVLANVLKEKGFEKARIGIEKNQIISTYWEKLIQLMPNAKFSECSDMFDRARYLKTPETIELMKNAAYKTDKAIATAFENSKVGDTELSLSKKMQEYIIDLGADITKPPSLASGIESYMVHLKARDKQITPGDVIHIDFGGAFSGYWTDVSRGGVCLKASPKQDARWKALWRAERQAIEDSAHVGKSVCDIYNSLKEEFKKNSIPFESYHGPGHVGHSIGLEVHEPPMIHPFNRTKLEANMILAIEPTVLEYGWARYHLEDMVLITKKGPEIISNYSTAEDLFVIEK